MGKLSWSVAILMMGISAVLISRFIILGDTTKDQETGVITININSSSQKHVFDEMNKFLEGIELINKAMVTKDNRFLYQAAEQSGGLEFMNAPKGLLKALPIKFKKMGAKTRQSFDEIVETHSEYVDVKLLENQLVSLMDNCTKCHNEYDFKDHYKKITNKRIKLFVENSNNK